MDSNIDAVLPEVSIASTSSQPSSSSCPTAEERPISKFDESFNTEIKGITKTILNYTDHKSILINLRRLKDIRLKIEEWHNISHQMYGTMTSSNGQIPSQSREGVMENAPIPPPRTMTYAECLKNGTRNSRAVVVEGRNNNSQTTVDNVDGEKNKTVDATNNAPKVEEVVQKKLNPHLIITGLDITCGVERLFQCLVQQNPFIRAQYPDVERLMMEVRVHHYKTYRVRSKFAKNVILEVNRRFRSLVVGCHVTIGWFRYGVKDYNCILRCYRCQYPGHISKYCTGVRACSYCSGPHAFKDCTAKAPSCCLCKKKNVEYDHEPYADNCTSYKMMIDNLIKNTDY